MDREDKKPERSKKPGRIVSMLHNVNLSSYGAEEQLDNAVRQFLLRWLHPSTSLKDMNEIGIGLCKRVLNTYPDDGEDDE